METSEVSVHQVKVYQAAKKNGGWMTVNEMKDVAGVSRRTAAQHALRFAQAGVFDLAELFPAHRYRLSEMAGKRNKTLLDRIERAADVFGEALA